MKKILIVMFAFFAVCGFNYAGLENSVSKEMKENLKAQLEEAIKEDPELDSELFKAAQKGDSKLIRQLKDKGANINARDAHNHTPLMYASFYGQEDACQTLIGLTADVNARDILNQTALFVAKTSKIAEALIKNTADINAQDNFDRTPLMHALEYSNLDVAFTLALHSPDLTLKDKGGYSAIMYMAANKNFSVEEPEHHDSQAILENYQIEEIFDHIMKSEDCTYKNNAGKTALDLAKLNGNQKIAEKIESVCK